MNEIMTKEEAEKFVSGKYDTELLDYLVSCSLARQRQILTEDDYKHISHCLKSLVADLFGFYPAGDLQPILRNDLFWAVGACDDTNILALNLYIKFLHNKVPAELLMGKEKEVNNGIHTLLV